MTSFLVWNDDTMKKHKFVTAGAALSVCVCGIANVYAAEQLGRMTVEVKVEGTQTWKDAQDYGTNKVSEYYRIVTHVKSDGEMDSVNTKAPDYADNMMAKANAVQRKVQQAQGRPAAPVPKTQEEYLASQKALGEQVQKAQAACKGDMNCLMKLAQQYAQQSAAIAYPVQAQPGVSDESLLSDPAPEDYRYLNYFGYEGCPTDIQIKIDNSGSGATADVQGMVPFTVKMQADTRGTDLDRKMMCLSRTMVYDTRERKIYTDGFGVPAIRGLYLYTEAGRREVREPNEEFSGNKEALEWVSQQLRAAPASGALTTRIAAPGRALAGTATAGAKFSGELLVTLNWKFEPLR